MDNMSLFDGHDDEGKTKDARLATQLQRVYLEMSSGYPCTLTGLSQILGYPEASIAARIRDLRKPRFGGHEVIRRHLGGGLYSYRLIPSEHGLLDGVGPRSAKAEVRARLRDQMLLMPVGPDPVYITIRTADLRELLR